MSKTIIDVTKFTSGNIKFITLHAGKETKDFDDYTFRVDKLIDFSTTNETLTLTFDNSVKTFSFYDIAVVKTFYNALKD